MYILTITNDLQGYISNDYENKGGLLKIKMKFETLREALTNAETFVKQGYSIAIEQKEVK